MEVLLFEDLETVGTFHRVARYSRLNFNIHLGCCG
jgi:hypothetical protein